MKEKLYTIPVNDAFAKESECPICSMYDAIEKSAIDFTMGESYMEDDVRMETDKVGFCEKHIRMMYSNQNRLGLALMQKTHMDHVIQELEKRTKQKEDGNSFFKKRKEQSPMVHYVNELEHSCYVCSKINKMFSYHLDAVLYLYKTDAEFQSVFRNSKGCCTKHYGMLYERGQQYFSSNLKNQFITDLNEIYLNGMKRVRDDLEWFIDKFDYRNADKPWNNSKDALIRSIIKTDSVKLE